jgi:hypothetical protein
VTVRLRNQGMGELRIDGLRLSNPSFFRIARVNGKAYNAALPLRVPSGGYADVLVKFVAANPPGNNGRVKVLHETLVISSNDPAQPVDTVRLHGLWQRYFEGNNEPFAGEIVEAFGFKTQLGFRQVNNKHDAPLPNSDEIFAPYFVRADPARPVTVRQWPPTTAAARTRNSSAGTPRPATRGRGHHAARRRGRAVAAAPPQRRGPIARTRQLQPQRAVLPAHPRRLHRSQTQ